MGRYFDITTPAPEVSLDATRSGVATFTVSNATPSTIGGQAVIDPGPGAEPGWFTIDRPSRTFPPQHSESIAVAISVPPAAAPGRYGFVVRVLLGGGVPEEDYDDSPQVTFTIAKLPSEPTPPPPAQPPPRKFPWWIVIVAAVIALIVIVGIVAFILTRGPAGPDLTVEAVSVSDVDPTVLVQIGNNGDQAAGPFNVGITVTRIGSGLSPFVFNRPVAGLEPGASEQIIFDSEVFGGQILLVTIVDTGNQVAESNEDNNTVQSEF